MKLAQWLQKIEAFHPSDIELGLDRIQLLANRLDLLELKPKIITVGGTNGKGSCVAMLESLAVQSGLKVGCYTSPHLVQFNERIRLNAANVSDNGLIDAFEAIEQERQALSEVQNSDFSITFFEFTTLTALFIFKQAKLDLVVLEVGLGGRLDAVNILDPNIAIVTTIANDHESWLGSDLVQIAFEKSGIFRRNIANFVGDPHSLSLILKSRPEMTSHVELPVDDLSPQLDHLVHDREINPRQFLKQNLALAVVGFNRLFPQKLKVLNLANSIKYIQLSGRFQVVSNKPFVVLDIAHNEQAAKNLALQLNSKRLNGKRYAICGMMEDKSINRVISALAATIDCWFFVDLPTERAASASQLNKIASKQGVKMKCRCSKNVSIAYNEVKSMISNDDQLVVFGSFITVAEMLKTISTG